ncbi:AAWKG family protein [Streptomyces sp. GC420]|uniref:AAWKG family protein n=1 Tax=Streptomyces sp. GC420 TaxID=2697568 RepID=UPI001414DB9B|nr:AAWKG family protein [Streptomyces sp. GC420]NBM20623.1 hypothetical protein [Streptomyces sp. GC420]
MTTPPQTRWEYVVGQLTGFAGGKREDVGSVGSTADQSGEGIGWLRAAPKLLSLYPPDDTSIEHAGNGPERVIRFYDIGVENYWEVTLTVPWAEGGNDFSDNGKAGAYDWGYGQALKKLFDDGTTAHLDLGYQNVPPVDVKDAIQLTTIMDMAKSFDDVRTFFVNYQKEIEAWHKSLGEEDAAWKGSAADVFRSLVDGLNLGYKDLGEDLTSNRGPGSVQLGNLPAVTAGSSVGKEILRCVQAIHDAAGKLHAAWTRWTTAASPDAALFLPTCHLDRWIDKVAAYLNEYNIQKVSPHSTLTKLEQLDGFSIYYEPFGDLTQKDAWQKLGQQAYRDWVANLAQLDTAATEQAIALNNAFADLESLTSTFTFAPGFTDLRTKYTEDQTKQQQEDLKNQQDNPEDKTDLGSGGSGGGLDDTKTPPGLDDPNDLKDKVPPPTLDLNNPDGSLGSGQNGSQPPSLGLNGPGGGLGGVIQNPDGSTSVRNPDGSYTTTFPDGHRETTAPGVLPPGLGLNPPGLGTGSGTAPLKTVKGPDGSTTAYNQDGSRTITHKDGTTTTIARDGTTTTVNPDGTTTVLHRDGSETITYPDGTRTTVRPDGSTLTQYKDGSTLAGAPDGTLTTTDAEGNKTVSRPEPGETVHNPDGSTTTWNKDGSTTTVHANGTRTTVNPNGTVTTVDPDGTKTVSHLGKNTSTIEYADGSVAKVDKDGTVVTTYKDGTATRLGPDGTYTTTDPDGGKTTEHLNPLGGKAGAQTTHNQDGSTTTNYPDGTVDVEFKDGGHKITYPDGRTVTTDADGRTVSVTGGLSSGLDGTSSGRLGDFDYYDYPDDWSSGTSLTGSGYGSGSSSLPLLSANPLGQSLTATGGAGTGGTVAGERTRAAAIGESVAARSRAAQLAAEEAALARRPATTSGGMPFLPPMGGGMGGAGGQSTQSDERERATWVSEDEEVWGTDEGGIAGVIGR